MLHRSARKVGVEMNRERMEEKPQKHVQHFLPASGKTTGAKVTMQLSAVDVRASQVYRGGTQCPTMCWDLYRPSAPPRFLQKAPWRSRALLLQNIDVGATRGTPTQPPGWRRSTRVVHRLPDGHPFMAVSVIHW